MTLKLSQKGYVLVVVPLLFQLVMMLSLIAALNQAEQELKRTEYVKSLNYHFTMLTGLVVKLIGDAHLKGAESLNLKEFREARKKIEEELLALKQLSKTDLELHHNINDVGAVIDRSFLYFNEARRAIEVGNTGDVLQNLGNLRTLGRRIQGMLDKLTDEYRQLETGTPEIQSEQRDRLRNLILVTMILNVALALALVVFFNNSTARRHDVLVVNANRFSAGQALLEPLSGEDEIARIDKVFHEMAKSIDSAARQKSEFTAMIAHDLRSPLTSLRLTIEFLAKKYEQVLPADGLNEFVRVERDVERLVVLITELLDLDKLECGQMTLEKEIVPIAHIFESSISAIKSLADRHNLLIVVPQTEDVVYVDSLRMIQVVSNLLSNAVKFSPPDGQITVTISAEPDGYEFSVLDEGPGIPGDQLGAVFDRFRQIDSSKPGSGLGLAICKNIVELHGGQISAQNEPGKGARFTVRLPQAPAGS